MSQIVRRYMTVSYRGHELYLLQDFDLNGT
jgi:hypothetical protein